MAQDCGTHPEPRVAWRRPCRLHVLRASAVCAVVAAFAWPAAAAPADTPPRRPPPQPQSLWHAYPLDTGSSSPKPARVPRTAATSSSSDSSSWPVPLWVAIAALGAAAAAFAALWRRSGRPWPLAKRLAAEHGFVLPALGPRLFNGDVRPNGRVAAEVEPTPVTNASAAPRDSAVEGLLLKRGVAERERSEATKLKEKERRTPRQSSRDDVSVLRAKVAGSASRSASKSAPADAPPRLRPAGANRCQIAWWRGPETSQFQAHSPASDGRPTVIARSPAFRWSNSEPPPADLARARNAHAALRAELEAGGWVAARKGDHWYAVEFERRAPGGRRGKVDREQ